MFAFMDSHKSVSPTRQSYQLKAQHGPQLEEVCGTEVKEVHNGADSQVGNCPDNGANGPGSTAKSQLSASCSPPSPPEPASKPTVLSKEVDKASEKLYGPVAEQQVQEEISTPELLCHSMDMRQSESLTHSLPLGDTMQDTRDPVVKISPSVFTRLDHKASCAALPTVSFASDRKSSEALPSVSFESRGLRKLKSLPTTRPVHQVECKRPKVPETPASAGGEHRKLSDQGPPPQVRLSLRRSSMPGVLANGPETSSRIMKECAAVGFSQEDAPNYGNPPESETDTSRQSSPHANTAGLPRLPDLLSPGGSPIHMFEVVVGSDGFNSSDSTELATPKKAKLRLPASSLWLQGTTDSELAATRIWPSASKVHKDFVEGSGLFCLQNGREQATVQKLSGDRKLLRDVVLEMDSSESIVFDSTCESTYACLQNVTFEGVKSSKHPCQFVTLNPLPSLQYDSSKEGKVTH